KSMDIGTHRELPTTLSNTLPETSGRAAELGDSADRRRSAEQGRPPADHGTPVSGVGTPVQAPSRRSRDCRHSPAPTRGCKRQAAGGRIGAHSPCGRRARGRFGFARLISAVPASFSSRGRDLPSPAARGPKLASGRFFSLKRIGREDQVRNGYALRLFNGAGST